MNIYLARTRSKEEMILFWEDPDHILDTTPPSKKKKKKSVFFENEP